MWLNGSYVAPLRVVSGGVRASTHLAQIRMGTRVETAYIKAFTVKHDRWLFNEVAGGLLAQQAAIGAPTGGLLWVPLAALQHLFPGAVFGSYQGQVPCWACAPVQSGYGLAAPGVGDAAGKVIEAVRQVLLAWPGLPACVAFDEWVANTDRHPDNLLLAAGGRVVPIDHSDCFGGPEAHDFTVPLTRYRNRLLEDLFEPERLPLPTKAAVVLAGEQVSGCHERSTALLEILQPWLGEPLGLHWRQWLAERATHTAQWLRERVRLLV